MQQIIFYLSKFIFFFPVTAVTMVKVVIISVQNNEKIIHCLWSGFEIMRKNQWHLEESQAPPKQSSGPVKVTTQYHYHTSQYDPM